MATYQILVSIKLINDFSTPVFLLVGKIFLLNNIILPYYHFYKARKFLNLFINFSHFFLFD